MCPAARPMCAFASSCPATRGTCRFIDGATGDKRTCESDPSEQGGGTLLTDKVRVEMKLLLIMTM